eukprot:CAMPEP_0115006092 /NCGR_PEP_ID=MMETSP0216-20121206/20275_1 /TAXON_ID=223996 /ORGANISM="Protocruzia adherens, Strain Boccale" /LENGTH=412 /DNA_ID=CAMNT_0002372571 /DNA_START=145 /DNA_END=1383 /DNA_ORIENTATION=-
MGNCNFKTESYDNNTVCNKSHFQFHYVIGKGGFGKVWRVEKKKTREIFAMKEMSKAKIISKRSVNSVMNERKLLASLKHDFIVNMHYAFQDRENLFLAMDLLTGGDLRYHIGRKKRFTEEQTRFLVACIVEGLEYLHVNGILHRDIKPENLVLDNSGYCRITDLGIARVWNPENAQDTSGTPGYMAPEVMCRQNHGVAVDYFAVGVLTYEFMVGRRPYLGKSRKEIRDQILAKQVQLKKHEVPEGWSLEAADFVNKLLQRKPVNRLGLNGPSEVKSHAWIRDFPWEKLRSHQIKAPFIPSAKDDNFDYRQINANDAWNEANAELLRQNAMLLRRNSVQSLFAGYYYNNTQSNNNNYLPMNPSKRHSNSSTAASSGQHSRNESRDYPRDNGREYNAHHHREQSRDRYRSSAGR